METSFSLAASPRSTVQEWGLLPASCSPQSLPELQGHKLRVVALGGLAALMKDRNAGCTIAYEVLSDPISPCQAVSKLSTAYEFQGREESSIFKPIASLASL